MPPAEASQSTFVTVPLCAGDGPRLVALFREALYCGGRGGYSLAQRHALDQYLSDETNAESPFSRPHGFMAALLGRPSGFVSFTEGHVEALYVHPERAGQGAGVALLQRAEGWARQRRYTRMTVEASPCTVGFFSKAGFRVGGTRRFILRGVALDRVAMEKRL